MSSIDPQKLLDLYTKNKTYFQLASFFIAGLICYMIGVSSVHIPHKDVICKDEKRASDEKSILLSQKDKACEKRLRKQSDEDDKVCKERIKTEVDRAQKVDEEITCMEVCLFIEQCEQQGRCESL